MTYLRCADAAFAGNIPPGFDAVLGYLPAMAAYHAWSAQDWAKFPGYKLPCYVASRNGRVDGGAAAMELRQLGVPVGVVVVLDLETRVDRTYVEAFGDAVQAAGYKVWVYGSASTVQGNPELNGYFVADYEVNPVPVLQQVGVRAVQYMANLAPGYDVSLIKEWVAPFLWR